MNAREWKTRVHPLSFPSLAFISLLSLPSSLSSSLPSPSPNAFQMCILIKHACMDAFLHFCISAFLHMQMHTHTHTRTCTCRILHVHPPPLACVYVHMHVQPQPQPRAEFCILHMHMHTHTRAQCNPAQLSRAPAQRTHTRTPTHARTCTPTHAHTCTPTHARTCTRTCAHMCTRMPSPAHLSRPQCNVAEPAEFCILHMHMHMHTHALIQLG